LEGFRLSPWRFAIFTEIGANSVRNVVQQSGRPQMP